MLPLSIFALLFVFSLGMAYVLGLLHRRLETGVRRETAAPVPARPLTNLRLRRLTESERSRYFAEWERIRARFDGAPAETILDADRLVAEVLKARGGNAGSSAARERDLTMNFPELAREYRSARAVFLRSGQGRAGVEELRRAMEHYRRIFTGLLEERPLRRAA